MTNTTNGVKARLKALRVPTLVAAVCATGLIVSSAMTQESAEPATVDPSTVIAKIGETEITELDLTIAGNSLGQNVQNIPPAQRRSIIFRSLVETKLMAEAAREAGLDEDDFFKARVGFLTDDTLRSVYIQDKIVGSITPEEIDAAVDARIEELGKEENIRARHILVETEEEAKALVVELEGGKDFAELAAEKSTGPSGPRGGDLGFFGKGQMVPPFEEAAFALKVGEISAPVQSNFGWHVIKLEERRSAPVPQRARLENEVRQGLLFEKYTQTFDNLVSKVQVEIIDPTIDSEVLSANQ